MSSRNTDIARFLIVELIILQNIKVRNQIRLDRETFTIPDYRVRKHL